VSEFLSDNVEWLLLIVAYALERLQEIQRRKKLKSEVVESEQSKVKGKAAKVGNFLFDLLPLVSRIKRRK
jgi:hypothetical protein